MRTRGLAFVLLFTLAIVPLGGAWARDNPPPTPVPDGPVSPETYPQVTHQVVTAGRGTDALCDTMRWSAWSVIRELVVTDSQHFSRSRDVNNGSYPCDIDLIGVRGRYWIGDSLYSDTGMQTLQNSADKVVDTANSLAECAPPAPPIYARGDHKFQEAGIPSWYPVTDDAC